MFAAGMAHSAGLGDWVMRDLAPFMAGPVLFYLIALPLFRNGNTVPASSVIGLTWASGLAVLSGLLAFNGIQVQGLTYTIRVLLMEALGLGVCWILWILTRRSRAFTTNLLFHWAATSWLVWLAFPILGRFEGP